VTYAYKGFLLAEIRMHTAQTVLMSVTKADLLRRLTFGFNELNFNTSEQNKT